MASTREEFFLLLLFICGSQLYFYTYDVHYNSQELSKLVV
jgi:hypothetical protein